MTSKTKPMSNNRRARRDCSRNAIGKLVRQPACSRASGSAHSQLTSLDSFADARSVSRMFAASESAGTDGVVTSGNRGVSACKDGATVSEEGPSPYRCALCAKVLASKNQLKTHVMLSHEGKNIVSCPHCAKAFTRLAQLRKHIASCHDDRTMEYYCEKCTFKNRDVVVFNQHVHLHNVCRFCRNEFAQLARHLPKCPYRPA